MISKISNEITTLPKNNNTRNIDKNLETEELNFESEEKFIDNEKIEACITLNEDFLIKQKANIQLFQLLFLHILNSSHLL